MLRTVARSYNLLALLPRTANLSANSLSAQVEAARKTVITLCRSWLTKSNLTSYSILQFQVRRPGLQITGTDAWLRCSSFSPGRLHSRNSLWIVMSSQILSKSRSARFKPIIQRSVSSKFLIALSIAMTVATAQILIETEKNSCAEWVRTVKWSWVKRHKARTKKAKSKQSKFTMDKIGKPRANLQTVFEALR